MSERALSPALKRALAWVLPLAVLVLLVVLVVLVLQVLLVRVQVLDF